MSRKDPALPSPEMMARVQKLRPDVADRVWERAAILITHAGMTPAVADETALALEAGIHVQQKLGV